MSNHRIDVHHHILPSHYVETIGANAFASQGSSGRVPFWSLEDALAVMDQNGVTSAITSISAPGVAALTASKATALARRCNELAAEMVHERPNRFGMFACLPLHSIDAALAEARYAFEVLRADGVCLLSNYEGRYLGDASLRPLYEELNRREAIAFVHPTSPPNLISIDLLSPSALEFPFDTTRSIASLIFSGVTTDYPKIRWIFSHAGGVMPYLAGRVELLTRNNPKLRERIPNGFQQALTPMFFDSALSANAAQFAALRELVGDTQLLFGSDYPFGPKGQMDEAVSSIDSLHMPPSARKALLSENAYRLFPRLQVAHA